MRILIVKQILLLSILGNSLRAVGRISVLILCGNGVIWVYSVTLSDQILEGIEGGALAFSLLFARPREHGFITLRLKLKENCGYRVRTIIFLEGGTRNFHWQTFFLNIYVSAKVFFSDIIFVQTIFFQFFQCFLYLCQILPLSY